MTEDGIDVVLTPEECAQLTRDQLDRARRWIQWGVHEITIWACKAALDDYLYRYADSKINPWHPVILAEARRMLTARDLDLVDDGVGLTVRAVSVSVRLVR